MCREMRKVTLHAEDITVASSTRKNVKLVHKVVSQSQFSILQLIHVSRN